MASNITKLRNLLAELFMFEHAELDFGIYRIMNSKREEIQRFLDNDLLPQVHSELGKVESGEHASIETELQDMIANMRKYKLTDTQIDENDEVKVLRERLASTGDPAALEDEVFSQLAAFFRRYYKDGDYLALRRYKKDVYALPYEGEEVKLHWANADQYYIKSSEYFRDYVFKLPDDRRVHFKLVEADTEANNNKAAEGKERRFVLAEEEPLSEEDGDLFVRFLYRVDSEKQATLNRAAAARIFAVANESFADWLDGLRTKAPTEKEAGRTLLEKHLTDYTARNSFDYFIHKDLHGFLRRELDFYIKSEVMVLDDIEEQSAPRVEQYLAKVRAIRKIAHKIIDMLAQLEEFQKKLWLKKKFVVETNYCVTLDRVPEKLYAEIAANDAQREEWVRLFAIDEIRNTTISPNYTIPLTADFLKANRFLVLDTRFFPREFKDQLLGGFDKLDAQLDGLLVHSENFQGLNLLQERYREQIQCIYIDPPYNTDASAIVYKNNYKDSSWLSLIENRLGMAAPYLLSEGIVCIAIDDTEFARLKGLIDAKLGNDAILGVVVVRSNPAGRSTPKGFAEAHEYAIFVAASEDSAVGRLPRTERQLARYSERDEIGSFEWVNFRKHGGREATREARPKMFYPIFAKKGNGIVRLPQLEWNETTSSWILLEKTAIDEEVVWPLSESGHELRWKWGSDSFRENVHHFCARPDQIGKTGIYMKSRMNEEGMLPVTWWDDKEYSATEYGTNLLTRIFGGIGDFSFPKALKLVMDCLRASRANPNSTVLDYFAGSGTTGHAVINLNREDGGKRKYILVEMGTYFETVTKPRILKVVYSKDWKDGKPVSREGSSHLLKYIRLESYESVIRNYFLGCTRFRSIAMEPR